MRMLFSRRSPTPTLALGMVAAATALSSCTMVDPELVSRDDGAVAGIDVHPPSHVGMPLPAGSSWETAGSVNPGHYGSNDAEGSLKPGASTPEERVPQILKRGRLVVGVDRSQNLLSFRDPVSGEITGFEAELARELARDIFGDPDAIDFRYLSSNERVNALNDHEVDVIVRTMTITSERQNEIQFSAPYVTTATRILTVVGSDISGYSDLVGRTVCAAVGSTTLNRLRDKAPRAHILKVQQWSDCFMAVQQRQVDAVVTDDLILAGMMDQDPFARIVGEPDGAEQYGIGVRASTPDDDASGLVRQVNYTLERIHRDGTWERLFNTWFGPNMTYRTQPAPVYRQESTQ